MGSGLRLGEGCGPRGAAVIGGAIVGFLALSSSGAGMSPIGLFYLLGGYIAGALIGHFTVVLVGRLVGKWWEE